MNTGGWLETMGNSLLNMSEIELCILARDTTSRNFKKGNLTFFSFQENSCKKIIMEVLKREDPNIIHIWGTEFVHSLETLKIAKWLGMVDKCVVSIQGLVSLYGKYHYTIGLPEQVVKRFTFRDFVCRDNISWGKRNFIERGKAEITALKMAKHIIGRTDWDQAAVEMFNPNAQYYHCNESLRDVFYKANWDIELIQPKSIFVSQCGYPIKGFHFLLEAMPWILEKYPETHLYTTGNDLVHLSLKNRLLISSYHAYLLELIKQYNLEEKITFLGQLSDSQMQEHYLKANVFVSPSTIENSPNSLGEAMILGTPCVSSDVGGVKNIMDHGKDGFVYPVNEPYMLAYYVKRIFDENELAIKFSKAAKKHANLTHSREKNMEKLLAIYNGLF